jgi:hypothetical protein
MYLHGSFCQRSRKALKDKPIVFITISVDKSEKAWQKAVNKYHISGGGVTTYWLGESESLPTFSSQEVKTRRVH